MPNLEQMTLDWINIDQIRFIAQTAKKLETLHIKEHFDTTKEQFEVLKQNSNIVANHPIQLNQLAAPYDLQHLYRAPLL